MSEAEVKELLARIAGAPRPAGSPAEAAAREACADWLRAAGFDVVESRFEYSAWPGLHGGEVIGTVLFLISLCTAALIASVPGSARVVMLAATPAVAVTLGCAAWLGRSGTRVLPWMRRVGTNLEATRGAGGCWFVAHLDSKSQPFSLLVRAGASVGFLLLWVAATVISPIFNRVPVPTWLLVPTLGAAALLALPVMFSGVGDEGTGALDNASGVATVLAAARLLPEAEPAGVLITSAEELGLAGARAWVEGRKPGRVINCDGVDDSGTLTVTAGWNRSRAWRSASARRAAGPLARFRTALPGILLDAAAFSAAGWAACTLSRGRLGSLRRVHTARDTMRQITGTGILDTARAMVALGGVNIA